MVSAAVTFVLCLAIIVGAYWMFVVYPEGRQVRSLRKRLTAAPSRARRTGLTKKAPPLSALKLLDKVLTRSGDVVKPLQRWLALSGLQLTVGVLVLGSAFAAAATLTILQLIQPRLWLSLALAAVAAYLPIAFVRLAMKRRVRKLEEQFPQAIDQIAVALRAGHAFVTGLQMVAEDVPDPLGAEFRLVYEQQKFGKPLPDVLRELVERVPLLDMRIFVTAVLTQRETGGNLAEVLDKLSGLIRERFTVRGQVRAMSAHGRITGLVLSSLPAAVATVMFFTAPDYLRTLITDPIGPRLIAGAITLQLIGTLAIRRIVNIEI
jgi:tight adherence protein B